MFFLKSKLNEQNEQIRFLNDENTKLKSIVSSLNFKLNNSEAKKDSNNELSFDANLLGVEMRKKYELTIDNVIRQLLNTLKINETAIKHSYLLSAKQRASNGSLSSHASSKSSISSLIINDSTINSNPTASSQFSSDSLEVRKMKQTNKTSKQQPRATALNGGGGGGDDDQFVKSSSSWIFNQKFSNETLTYLLIEQKKQQLTLLTELSLLSQSLKEYDTDSNSKLKENSNDESISLSSLKSLSSSQSTSNTNSELIANIINLIPPAPTMTSQQQQQQQNGRMAPDNIGYYLMTREDEIIVSCPKPIAYPSNYSLNFEN